MMGSCAVTSLSSNSRACVTEALGTSSFALLRVRCEGSFLTSLPIALRHKIIQVSLDRTSYAKLSMDFSLVCAENLASSSA